MNHPSYLFSHVHRADRGYRPSLIHEYRITKPSLHSAMSIGLETKVIIEVLSRLSKTPLSPRLVARIEEWTASFGKVRLVLKDNRYFLETSVPEFLQKLMNDEVIKECMVHREEEAGPTVFGAEEGARPRRDFAIPGTEEARRRERVKKPNRLARMTLCWAQ